MNRMKVCSPFSTHAWMQHQQVGIVLAINTIYSVYRILHSFVHPLCVNFPIHRASTDLLSKGFF